MKYWKGITGTAKQGKVGTMDDNGKVPDSLPATKTEYDIYVGAQPVPVSPKAEYALLTTDSARIAYIAKKQGLI